MFDYNQINCILARDLENVSIDDLIYIQRIVKVILRNFKAYSSKNLKNGLTICDSLKQVYKFLSSINPNYADIFNKKLNDGTINCDYNFDMGLSYIDIDYGKRILVPIHHDIQDSFIMIHEFMHDMNLKVDSASASRYLFTETFSFLGEMLYNDYLIEKGIYVHDANVHMEDVFSSASRINMKNDFEINLYLYYLKYGNINARMLDELCINDYEYSFQVYYSLMDAYKKGTFALDYDQRYSIGILFACYMHERILENPKNIYELWDLNEIINDITIDELIYYLDLDIESSNNIVLTSDSMNKLEKSYQKSLKKIG